MPILAIALAPLLAATSANPVEAVADETIIVSDMDVSEVRRRVADFDKSLRVSGLPGRVLSCTTVVDVSFGTMSSNHSYGAICSVAFGKKVREYLLCNDAMVGHFAFAADYVHTREWVVRFVTNNCVGG